MGAIFLLLAVLAVLAGVGGAYVIARNLPGLAAIAALLAWLALPFVILFAAFSSSVDPTLPPERARDNVAMAFVLTSIVIAVPWFAANLVGGILGRRKRHAQASPAQPVPAASRVSAPASATQPAADPDLPDWRQYDQPSLALDQLGGLMHEIAARAGIEPGLLPHVGYLSGADGEFLDRDKFDYIYIGLEQGVTTFDHRDVIADKTMYQVFGNVSRKLAARRLAEQGVVDGDHAVRLADEQQRILAGIDARWGRQFALDRARQ